ncbi:MAG TPA: hypothetical protein VMA31_10935 [Bryobacteraceae bacterium]|nr:hypothetical protein [Bryobacteraceae bacterium]
MFATIGVLFSLIYVALLVLVIYLVITALNRIATGVEDVAQTLRRMESGPSRPGGTNPPLT